MTALLEPGSVIADRFVIDALAGSGGMGTVYRAHDRVGDRVVAVKLCRVGAAAEVTRFEREIRALATVRHPGIVAYVADGHTADGQPFLAMEWLAGEELARRLLRGEPLRPRMLALISEELGWQLDFRSSGTIAAEVLRISPPGSMSWSVAVAGRIFDVFLHGHPEVGAALLDELYTAVPEEGSLAKLAFSLFAGMYWLYLDGQPLPAMRLLDRLRELASPVAADERLAYSWYCLGHTHLDAIGAAGPASCLEYGRRCGELFQALQHRRGELLADISIGRCLGMLGRHAEAERVLQRSASAGVDVGPIDGERVSSVVEMQVAQGRVDEAIGQAEATLGRMHRRNATETLFEGAVRSALATALRAQGQLARAEEEARTACTLARYAMGVWLTARVELAAVLLARGQAAEAAAMARECIDMHAARGFHGPRETRAHRLVAEALAALGDRDGARAAILRAREVVLERAGKIADEALRRGYLADIVDHATILRLADAWAPGPVEGG